MKKLLLGAVVALLPLTGFSATILGFQAGGGLWTHDPSGSISTSNDTVGVSANLKNDLKLSEEQEGYTYFLVEHPVPLIPNFKYVDTKLTHSGTGTANFTFDSVDYVAGANTTFELNQTDLILYYEILDNVISLDIGLNAKQIDGQVAINTTPTAFSGTIPMLYVAAEISLPAGFTIAGEISTISAGSDEITDLTAKVTYTTDFNLGVEAGIRTQTIVVDVDDVQADIEFSGLFAGVYFKF
ncbi:MAG: TIGR04219 family outer membrane beta-barrel protein [Gammaproteobacteria bacterium]|nr:TIGR04219 family outer membrane beta-barrel protein [Gammaproteobacteria bacterium]